tara:strand:+ start:33 stop:329 length:297 start_codon:yes stop_codon:yes gene_type:complete
MSDWDTNDSGQMGDLLLMKAFQLARDAKNTHEHAVKTSELWEDFSAPRTPRRNQTPAQREAERSVYAIVEMLEKIEQESWNIVDSLNEMSKAKGSNHD